MARQIAEPLGLAAPDVAAIVEATKASRSRAYEVASTLLDALPTLVRPVGRPHKSSPQVSSDERPAITHAVLAYVMSHPGSVDRGSQRQWYSDEFRQFVLDLRVTHSAFDLESFAAAAQVPLGTLKDWVRPSSRTPASEQSDHASPSDAQQAESSSSELEAVEPLHIQSVLNAWKRWEGNFTTFCEHVSAQLHIPFGRNMVRNILFVHGVRQPESRPGRTSDESATRRSFETHFAGAQWVGDGMQVPVTIDNVTMALNLELNVDAHTGALVGLSVRKEEDSQAVIDALNDGVATTGAKPIAELLDNKPSNHTPEVDAALGDTLRVRATTERPQNKAHVEGAFGLFSRKLPPLVFDTSQGLTKLGQQILGIVAAVWARTLNHKARMDRDGESRVDLYAKEPSDEQIANARTKLRELAQRQERARRTLEARRRPEVLKLLDDTFERLQLLDPDRHIRIAMAGHPLDAIVAGIAIFEGKLAAKTLPEGADARYLHGIVRNVAAKVEGEHVARKMLELRLDARDRMLSPLVERRDAYCAMPDVARACHLCVDEALGTASPLDRTFWLTSIATLINAQPATDRQTMYRAVARRIHATFAVSLRERHDAVRAVAERLVPLA
jgi:hypothetical protein